MSKKTEDLLNEWSGKYSRARASYQSKLDEMIDNEQAYLGTRKIKKPDGMDAENGADVVPNVRKVVYELIESQVDSTIPMPKVTPTRAEDDSLATIVEEMLKNQIDRLDMERINDEQERVCPVDGSVFFLVEWDNDKEDVVVKTLHPRNIIPQPGVSSIEDSDYIFVVSEHTQDAILRKYGVDVGETPASSEEVVAGKEQNQTVSDMHTMYTVYFRNDNGGISLFSWIGTDVIEYIPDYQRRKKNICSGCGVDWEKDFEKCPICGSTEYEMTNRDYETIVMDTVVGTENALRIISADTKIPYYTPDCFPIVMRKNISQYGEFCGGSDAQAIKDQQNDINILMTKLRKKILMGGSIILKPEDMKMDTSDAELKITNCSNNQKTFFEVINIQPDIQYDLAIQEKNYEIARQTLGITDSLQGRPDPTAPSGKAKQMMIQQSAGRLESKRKMKDAAFADLYKLIFKFMLAYSDEKRAYRTTNAEGDTVFKEFNKFDFVEQIGDEWVWNDRFLFSVDDSSALSRNRELMWQETRFNYQNGCFGNPGDINAVVSFWYLMKLQHYPNAKYMYEKFQLLLAQQIQQQQIMMQAGMQMPQAGGMQPDSSMPQM